MIRYAALAVLLASPAFAQTTPLERVEKARTEVNTAENALGRALYALDKALEAMKATPVPTPTPEPEHPGHEMPEPPAFKPLTVNDIKPIADDVDTSKWIMAADIPGTMAPDNVGAFRFICNVSHYSYDDAIAFPGQPGKAHLHMFFGNTKTDAFSTYESLRTSGGSSCQVGDLNRSGYWVPALLTQPVGGQIVVPNSISLYYKRRVKDDPECTKAPHKGCVGIPAGLRAIFGTNYTQGHNQSLHVRFDCNRNWHDNFPDMVADCKGAPELYARIGAPECWDGLNLDAPDHQSHLAYMTRDANTGRPTCPVTHPYIIPKLELGLTYAVLDGDTPETWIYSSDVQAGKKAGTTFHADYMEAWRDETRLTWEANCIDKLLSCTAGNLGNGTLGRQPIPFSFAQRPHLLPIPDRP